MLYRVRMSSHLPQLEVLPGTLRKVGELLVQHTHSCSSLKHCQVRRGWAQELQGNSSFSQLPMVDDSKMECSSGGTKKPTYFINNKGNNLRYWLYCLSSEQLVDIGVSAVLLHSLSSLEQACNI